MKKESPIEILQRVLQTDANLEFLEKLDIAELEVLIACIRDRVENRSNLSWKEQGDTKLIFQEVYSKPKSTQPQYIDNF